MDQFGHVRIATLSPHVRVGNPQANVDHIVTLMRRTSDLWRADIVLLPELAITGYTCGDLFQQAKLITAAQTALLDLAGRTQRPNGCSQLIVVGCPVAVKDSLYNCAVVLQHGNIVGVVPKQFLPNYREFYELRWFRPADGSEPKSIDFIFKNVPFGIDLLFEWHNVKIGVEVCEDLWMPIPPSSYQALAGATILLNCSASNEVVGKANYRRDLVVGQSARCIAAYAYSSCGWEESTSDLVFGGHCLIAENGNLLTDSGHVGGRNSMDRERGIVSDVDVERLLGDRRGTTSFDQHPTLRQYRNIPVYLPGKRDGAKELYRHVNGTPFVPKKENELKERCKEIFDIQVLGLSRRLESAKVQDCYIGVSGGLDSTLALLVAHKAYVNLYRDVKGIHGITMPGFGTTAKTKNNAEQLMASLRISRDVIDIRPAAMQAFRDMGHKPFGIDLGENGQPGSLGVAGLTGTILGLPPEQLHDLVFENVQARLRTFFLMSKGFVIGTGDLSEAALGWCTYNGDHMSMYNPNCSIPKTLVKFLVGWAAQNEYAGELRNVLLSIVGTEISPELLPPDAQGNIVQSTESILGPYELHDFFLMNFKRYGYSPEKIMFLAGQADFGDMKFSKELIKKTMKTFITRFFGNQFKRNCVPDGPKVGTVSLSPRGDWRMPSDADRTLWLEGLE